MTDKTRSALIFVFVGLMALALGTFLFLIVKDAIEHPCVERREFQERCRVKTQGGGYAETTCFYTRCVRYK